MGKNNPSTTHRKKKKLHSTDERNSFRRIDINDISYYDNHRAITTTIYHIDMKTK